MSKLEDINKSYREKLIKMNDYDSNDVYDQGNPDALSTGDEKGKGEVNGQVGGATDIKTRNALLAKNKYSSNKPYDAGTA